MANMMNNISFRAQQQQQQYAHVVKENPFQKVASSVQKHTTNFSNIGTAITKGKGSDHTLGMMNDTTIRLGSLGIATLASSKALSPMSGLGEFIGFCCWFAAMGISPKIINKMVQAKYGLDLDKEYIDSYGRRKKLFEDPGFICWDLIPNQELDRIGDKMGVPKNIVNRREAIQEKITQVVVQAKTWTMVSAGVATPVIASLVADTLKKPVNNIFKSLHASKMNGLEAAVENALKSGSTDKAKQLLQKAVKGTFGETDASALARMWKDAPEQVTRKTGIIDGAVARLGEVMKKAKEAISGEKAWIPKIAGKPNPATQAKKLQAIVDHLAANPDKANEGVKILQQNIDQVKGWQQLLMKYDHLLDDATKEFIRVRTLNLESGFGSMQKVLQNNADPKLIRKFLRGITDAQAQRKSVEQIAEFLGKSTATEVKQLLKDGKTEKAIDLISKRGFNFIDDAAKDILLHRRWLKRIGAIGIGLLAATAIYTFFFMGKNNKYNPAIKENGGKA